MSVSTLLLIAVSFAAHLLPGSASAVADHLRSSPISFWQTYSQSPPGGIHQWTPGASEYRVDRLGEVDVNFRTGYGWIKDGSLILLDRPNKATYRLVEGDRFEKLEVGATLNRFRTADFAFTFDAQESVVKACSRLHRESCTGISIKPGTFPYVYAGKGDAVLVISNFGEALLFKNDEWCRMSMAEDIYACTDAAAPVLNKPREIQFYSSIYYHGRVLLGEWPTGRLYEFDGSKLFPSELTPPQIEMVVNQRLGYEAQSMAEYCGDLFVGYWPRGELYRFDHKQRSWSLLARLFSEDDNSHLIPYLLRAPDDLLPAFFGQRITALLPYDDALYAVTSNLRSWDASIVVDQLPTQRIKEYGAVHKISRLGGGCRSTYTSDSHAEMQVR